MTELFQVAKCIRCGGALNLKTLECPYCGTSYKMDWSKAIPTIGGTGPPEGYYPERDQRMDAVLLTMLQAEAAKQNVEVVLTLESQLGRLIIAVYVRDKKYGQLEKVGKISCRKQHTDNGGFDYRVSFEGQFVTYSGAYKIQWAAALGAAGNRVYKVTDDEDLTYWPTPRVYHGEDELIERSGLRWVIEAMVGYASHWETYEREQAERTERAKRTAKRSLWKELSDWWKRLFDTSRQLP